LIFPWDNAPQELQEQYNQGGDEDYLVIAPADTDELVAENLANLLRGPCDDTTWQPSEYQGRKVMVLVTTH
jgi:hypothetical protein